MPRKRSVQQLVQPHLRALEPYKPVDPPEVLAKRYGLRLDQVAKLDANENPYGPSPKVVQALAGSTRYSIYPDPLQRRARQAIADYAGVNPEQVVAGAGCDELIDLLARLVLAPRDEVVDFPPTFGMYPFAVAVQGGKVVAVPRLEDFSVDLQAAQRAISSRTKIIFLCNPNNPTGTLMPESTIRSLAELGPLLVVDETYHEFCGSTAVPLLSEYENLVVLRSFSKWAGLAGLRLGYGVMAPQLVQQLIAIKSPYNLNAAAEAALYATLDDTDLLLQRVRTIVEERVRLEGLLATLPGIRHYSSKANFMLCRFSGAPAHHVQQELAKRGLIVRHFSTPPIQDCLRISVGLREHTDRIVEALRQILPPSDSSGDKPALEFVPRSKRGS
ncbi:MAG: histidinol-phosphate transaminase [Dehalococcoidia bacterium]|nr:histidinol-phosphate transaminase [Dehalococcoidia bacterium]